MAQAFDPADELDDFDPLCGQEPLLAVPQHSSNGRYVLLAALGAGAAAQVFQAIDTSTGEEVGDVSAPHACGCMGLGGAAGCMEQQARHSKHGAAWGCPSPRPPDLAQRRMAVHPPAWSHASMHGEPPCGTRPCGVRVHQAHAVAPLAPSIDRAEGAASGPRGRRVPCGARGRRGGGRGRVWGLRCSRRDPGAPSAVRGGGERHSAGVWPRWGRRRPLAYN